MDNTTSTSDALVRTISLRHLSLAEARIVLGQEWLLTNGLGGYASGTICGSVSRRYHGLLIAALPAPLGRVVMLNHLAETLCLADDRCVQFGGEEPNQMEGSANEPSPHLVEFQLDHQAPIWRYEIEGNVIEKRVHLVHGQNTVHISYLLLAGGDSLRVELRPSMHFRPHENDVGGGFNEEYAVSIRGRCYEVLPGENPHLPYPPLRMLIDGDAGTFTYDGGSLRELAYQMEAERGYHSRGVLWNPGHFHANLRLGRSVTLIASTEAWPTILAMTPEEARLADQGRRRGLISLAHPKARKGAGAELVLAADQFLMAPAGRHEDTARARAAGGEIRSVIAGYHWFTDWGRDTMISLEGLTLATGRYTEGGWILRTFAHYIRDGLIPNYFPDGKNEAVYHTADATLWYFHAVSRYIETTGDRATLRQLLPKLRDIIEHHLRGTRFGIGVDPQDGLLKQGAEGYQLTWMDAKVDGWVVTPRRGKAVEINALWYNALRVLENWLREEKDEAGAEVYAEHARRCYESFNKRFWCASCNYLYDVVDGENGDDNACRPNQVFSISLTWPVLARENWTTVLETVRDKLLTPVGLRSLSRDHPDYKPRYFGDLRARDAAYHQGTVWGWLIGPFIDAWLKVNPDDRAGARRWLEASLPHLDQACVGQISEVFDAEAPFTPRGCIAQAWSVAEALRCWVKTAEP